MKFAQIAKDLREGANLSQKALSEKLGISSAAVGHLETGRNEPTATTLIAYAKYFNISIDDLLEHEEFSSEERTAGFSDTRKISITPIEDDMLYEFRQIGKKRGEEAQRALITIAKNMQ